MKKLLFALLALCVVLCACGENNEVTETTEFTGFVQSYYPVYTTKEPEATVEPTEIAEVKGEYGENVDVNYEVIVLNDEEVDAILKANAELEISKYVENVSSVAENEGTVEYDVKLESLYRNDNIISAVFYGYYSIFYPGKEESGEVFYTVNIDPVNGKVLSTEDIVSDYEKMKAAFTDADLSHYNTEYGIYPYVSVDEKNFYLYVTDGENVDSILEYNVPLADADFIKIQF